MWLEPSIKGTICYTFPMSFPILGVLIATVLQFIIGAIWYMPLFGNLWSRIHGFDKVAPEEQKAAQKQMGWMLAVQFLVTLITTGVFALLLNGFPSAWNIYGLAFFFWLGFVLPTQVSAVLFGGTKPEWIVKKIAVAAGGALVCLFAAAFVLQWFR